MDLIFLFQSRMQTLLSSGGPLNRPSPESN